VLTPAPIRCPHHGRIGNKSCHCCAHYFHVHTPTSALQWNAGLLQQPPNIVFRKGEQHRIINDNAIMQRHPEWMSAAMTSAMSLKNEGF
jgi:hypothetical protein